MLAAENRRPSPIFNQKHILMPACIHTRAHECACVLSSPWCPSLYPACSHMPNSRAMCRARRKHLIKHTFPPCFLHRQEPSQVPLRCWLPTARMVMGWMSSSRALLGAAAGSRWWSYLLWSGSLAAPGAGCCHGACGRGLSLPGRRGGGCLASEVGPLWGGQCLASQHPLQVLAVLLNLWERRRRGCPAPEHPGGLDGSIHECFPQAAPPH